MTETTAPEGAHADLATRLRDAYEKVKMWPEHKPNGLIELLELRNLAPEAADAIAELVAENERLRADNEYQRCIMETMREHIGKLAQCIPNPKD